MNYLRSTQLRLQIRMCILDDSNHLMDVSNVFIKHLPLDERDQERELVEMYLAQVRHLMQLLAEKTK